MAATDGKVLCLGNAGQTLPDAPDVTLKAPAMAAGARGGVSPTASHPDFAHLSQVRIASSDLGWRLTAAAGQVGFALQQLPTPLTKQATFKFRLHMIPKDTSADPPRNGFFVLGDAPEEPALVKCGMRRKQGLIIQGPYINGKSASQTLDAKVDETCDVVVAVDLSTQQIAMTIHGQAIETKLDRRLDSIKFVGYCANSVTSEFSAIDVSGQ